MNQTASHENPSNSPSDLGAIPLSIGVLALFGWVIFQVITFVPTLLEASKSLEHRLDYLPDQLQEHVVDSSFARPSEVWELDRLAFTR